MRNGISIFFAAAALVTAGACGGGGSDGSNYSTTIDEANMGAAADLAGQFLIDVKDGLISGNPGAQYPGSAPAMTSGTVIDRLMTGIFTTGMHRVGRPELALTHAPRAINFTTCAPTVTGDGTDTDADGIPDDLTVTFPANCTETAGDRTWTYSGSYRLQDIAGLYAFSLTVTKLKYHEVNNVTGDTYDASVNGVETAVYASNHVDHDADLAYVFLSKSGSVSDGVTISWVESTNFTPASAFTVGDPFPSGNVSVDLTLTAVVVGSDPGAFQFHLTTPTVLHYDASTCYDINSGQLKGALNNSATIYFLITWTGCGITIYESHGTTA